MAASTLEILRAKRLTALSNADAIIARAKADGDRDLTDAEDQEVEKFSAEAKAAAEGVAKAERSAARRKDVSDQLNDLSRPNARKSIQSDGDLDGLPVATASASVPNFLKDPMRGFKSHQDLFLAVKRAGCGEKADERLRSISGRYGVQADGTPITPNAAAGSDEQSTFSDPYGGFLITKTTAPGVLQVGYDPDPLAGLTQKIPMTTVEVSLNARVDKDHTSSVSGGLVVYRRNESQIAAPSRMQFEQVVLHADALMGVAYATEEVLRDSPISFAAVLERGFRDQFGAKAIIERLDGSGVGAPLGVNNAACKIDVAKEAGQAAGTINYKNVIKMRARCFGYGNAVWYANHDCLPEIMSITAPGSTIPLVQQTTGGVETLFGRPIFFGEFAKSIGTVGDIHLTNWSEYLEGEYEPIQGLSSTHVRFVEHEQVFKFWKRNCGQPWWKTALTPANGPTLSPFIRLAAR